MIALLLELPQCQPLRKGIGLGKVQRKPEAEPEVVRPTPEPVKRAGLGPCRNPQCITSAEPLEPAFVEGADGRLVCAYCEEECKAG